MTTGYRWLPDILVKYSQLLTYIIVCLKCILGVKPSYKVRNELGIRIYYTMIRIDVLPNFNCSFNTCIRGQIPAGDNLGPSNYNAVPCL
jgi:hypothetical protein